MIGDTSVIICSRDRPRLLLETIRSVLDGDQLPAEIVVVDQSRVVNQALAQWREDVESRWDGAIRYIHSTSTGLSRARNLAICAARHDLLVIIDDDMFVERAWLGTLVAALKAEGPCAVVTGRVLPDQTPATPGSFVPALATAAQGARYRGRLQRDVLAGGHMAAYRRTLLDAGGFDERLGAGSAFPAADDNDLGFRLLERGCEIVYVPDAVVYHRAWRPKSEYLRVRWRYGRGKGGFYAKHLRTSGRYMVGRVVRDLGRRAVAFPGRLKNDTRGAAGDVVYGVGVLIGVVQWSLGLRKTQ